MMQTQLPVEDNTFVQQVWSAVTNAVSDIRLPDPVRRACDQYVERNRRFVMLGGAAVALSLILLIVGLLSPRQEPLTRETVLRLPPSEQQLLMQQALAEAAAQPDVYVSEIRPTDVVPLSIFSGEVHAAGEARHAMGIASIYEHPAGYILRLQGFSMTNGPQLRLMLSAAPTPGNIESAMSGAVDLGALKGNVGDQNYDIPPGTDLNQVRSVVIYSEPFGEIFAVAPLRP